MRVGLPIGMIVDLFSEYFMIHEHGTRCNDLYRAACLCACALVATLSSLFSVNRMAVIWSVDVVEDSSRGQNITMASVTTRSNVLLTATKLMIIYFRCRNTFAFAALIFGFFRKRDVLLLRSWSSLYVLKKLFGKPSSWYMTESCDTSAS